MTEKGSNASVLEEVGTIPGQKLPEPGSHERMLAEKALLRKLDMRLLPTIFVIFIMNYIDRNAVTSARLKGLQKDLGINDVQYATVIAILFVTYCPAQIPSTMILNKISRPSLYIGACTVLWGIISGLTGLAHNFSGIIASRIFLGLPEAAFYPGAIFLLSRWYTRKELAFRSALLYSGGLVSNAFGTLMAAGILANMEGKMGIRAWRWLFFIEGAITVVVGLCSMWLLPDYPENTRWMSEFETRLAQARLSEDMGEADKDNEEDSLLHGLKLALKDPKVYIFALISASQILGLSFAFYFPTLTKTLGYSTTVTLLLASPPWILVSILCLANAWHADKTGERFFHLSAWWWCAIPGIIIAVSTMSIPARYIALFLLACGYIGSALTPVWLANVVQRPPAKRAAAIGIVYGCGNLGAVMGSYTWKSVWGPQYHESMVISLCSLLLCTALSFTMRQILIRENRKLDADDKAVMEGVDRSRVEEAARLEGITFEQAMEKRKGFRYLY